MATFHGLLDDPQSPKNMADLLAIIEHVKKMPEVDAKSVVVWRISNGGSFTLELARETTLCAVAVEEPGSRPPRPRNALEGGSHSVASGAMVRLSAANQATDVFDNEEVKFSTAQHRFDLGQLWTIEPFALALGCNNAVIDITLVHIGDQLLPMIFLIGKAEFFLVGAAADSGGDADNQLVPIPWFDLRIPATEHDRILRKWWRLRGANRLAQFANGVDNSRESLTIGDNS